MSEFEVSLSGKKGLIAYGNDYAPGGSFVEPPTYHADNPPAVLFPPVVTADQIYKNAFSNTALTVYTGGAPPQPNSLVLVSDQLQSVTVPAGTYGCYELINTGQSVTQWIAPGVGMVQETLADQGTPYYQLTSFTVAANDGQSPIVPVIVGTNLSATVTAGSNVNATASVQLSNTGTANYTRELLRPIYTR